jgi:hypothetical protein
MDTTNISTWSLVTLAVAPALVTGLAAYLGVHRTIKGEGDRLQREHEEDARRSRLVVYHRFLDGDKQMRDYIADQVAGEAWEGKEERTARAEWYSAMNGVDLFSSMPVRQAFLTYQGTIAPQMEKLDLKPSNAERWTQLTEILNSEATINARVALVRVMSAEATS